MATEHEISSFLSGYGQQISGKALLLRELIFENLPNITEQIDIPARMIAYCYGQKYSEMICTIIPSQKGLKLGFNRGTELEDPENQLQGKGKISRYVEIKSEEQAKSEGIKNLLAGALRLYKQRG